MIEVNCAVWGMEVTLCIVCIFLAPELHWLTPLYCTCREQREHWAAMSLWEWDLQVADRVHTGWIFSSIKHTSVSYSPSADRPLPLFFRGYEPLYWQSLNGGLVTCPPRTCANTHTSMQRTMNHLQSSSLSVRPPILRCTPICQGRPFNW